MPWPACEGQGTLYGRRRTYLQKIELRASDWEVLRHLNMFLRTRHLETSLMYIGFSELHKLAPVCLFVCFNEGGTVAKMDSWITHLL